MTASLRILLVGIAALGAAPIASATAIVLHDFSAFESANTFFLGDWELNGEPGGTNAPRAGFTQGTGAYLFTGGTNEASSGAAHFLGTFLDATGLPELTLTAKRLAANAATGFTIALFDSSYVETAYATFAAADFSTADFTTVRATLTFSAGFNPLELAAFQVSGGVLGGADSFDFAFDTLAVSAPDPGTGVPDTMPVSLALALALGGVAAGRRWCGGT